MAVSSVSRSGRQRVANVERDVQQTAHAFVVGNPVFLDDADALWKKASAAAADTLGLFIVSRVSDANNFSIATAGLVSGIQAASVVGGGSLLVGEFYYVSAAVGQEGMVTAIEPSISNLIYQAFTSTSAFVLPFRPALLGVTVDPLIANNVQTSAPANAMNFRVGAAVTAMSISSTGAVTVGPATGGALVHTFASGDQTQINIVSVGTNKAAVLRLTPTGTASGFLTSNGALSVQTNGAGSVVDAAQCTTAGQWTFGPSANSSLVHTANGSQLYILRHSGVAFLGMQNNGGGSNLAVSSAIGELGFYARYAGVVNDVAFIRGTYRGNGTTRDGSLEFFTHNAGTGSEVGSASSAGAWTFGPTGFTGIHPFRGGLTTTLNQPVAARVAGSYLYQGSNGAGTTVILDTDINFLTQGIWSVHAVAAGSGVGLPTGNGQFGYDSGNGFRGHFTGSGSFAISYSNNAGKVRLTCTVTGATSTDVRVLIGGREY